MTVYLCSTQILEVAEVGLRNGDYYSGKQVLLPIKGDYRGNQQQKASVDPGKVIQAVMLIRLHRKDEKSRRESWYCRNRE